MIVNIVPGDFNGDSYMDLLFVYKLDNTYYQLSIMFGQKISKTVNEIELGMVIINHLKVYLLPIINYVLIIR